MKLLSDHRRRYLAVAAVFCIICAVFIVRLIQVQITHRSDYASDDAESGKIVCQTVQAVRGEIYDRNGVKLVANQYTYRFVLDYYALPGGRAEENDRLLDALRALDDNGLTYAFAAPLEGQYPHLSVKEGEDAGFVRLCAAAGLTKQSEQTLDCFLSHMKTKYRLDDTVYTEEQMTRLILLRSDLLLDGFGTKNLFFTLAENVDAHFIGYISERNLAGLTFSSEVNRLYCYPGYASHILGRISQIYSEDWSYYAEKGYSMNALVGVSGCELAFEDYLRGTDGEIEIKYDRDGNEISRTVTKQAVAGKDVYLTIDIRLQIAAEDGLAENAAYIQALGTAYENCKSGALTAMDPKTGELLAVASYPSYDLSRYNELYATLSADESKPLLNRATGEIYAPGSTFKLGVAAAAVTEGLLSPDSTLSCTGRYTYYSDYQPKCWVYPGSHGLTNVVKAIRVSCNCFFYEVGRLLGIEKLDEYAASYGLGQKTGIEIGEESGVLASPDEYAKHHMDEYGNPLPWTPGLTIQAAIGQCDNAFTPLQIVSYLSTLLNGGNRYAAHLLRSVRSFDGESVTETAPVLLGEANLSPDAVAIVKEGMRQAVYGNQQAVTGNELSGGNSFIQRAMKNIPVIVGAKTGTAQLGAGTDNALLVCAAPYDTPDIVICCVLERGVSGQYASIAAARVLEAFYRDAE